MQEIDLSIVIPCYNEEAIIEQNSVEIANYIQATFPDFSFEILIVDDGSTDSMPQMLMQAVQKYSWLRTIRYTPNRGRGKALRTGLKNAYGKYVITFDADLSYDPEHIAKILHPLMSGLADVVLASAYHKNGCVKNVPRGRAFLSKWGNVVLANSVRGNIKTVTCVVRGYTRDVVDNLILFSDDKDIHLEIIQKVQILGYKILEIPAVLCWRNAKRSRKSRGLSFSKLFTMCRRHLFFNFLFRPGSVFMIPQLVVVIAFLWSFTTIVISLVATLLAANEITFWSMLQLLRSEIQKAPISYFSLVLSTILFLQFLSMNLMAEQTNHHYDEMVRYMSKLEKLLKENAKKDREE